MSIQFNPNGKQLPDPLRSIQAAAGGPTGTAGRAAQVQGERAVSPELEGYLARARQTPEGQEDHIDQVLQRLENGYYLTPGAAERTAAQIPDDDLGLTPPATPPKE